MAYSRDQVIRDIVFLFHQCARFGTVYGDNDYGTLLRGPYYELFQVAMDSDEQDDPIERQGREYGIARDGVEDRFVQVGSVLMFVAMLVDWLDGSGFAFGTYRGECHHSLATYVRYLLRAYGHVRTDDDSPVRPVYAAALSLCSLLDKRGDLASELYPSLLDELRTMTREDGLEIPSEWLPAILADLYQRYVRAYFLAMGKA